MAQLGFFDATPRSGDRFIQRGPAREPRWYQLEAEQACVNSWKQFRSTLLVMATGLGKCLGRGVPVLRFDGSIVPVEDVRVGDMLMGPDSKPRRVLSLARGNGPMFRIVPIKGDPWTCNWCHILTLKHTETGKVEDVQLDEYLRKTDNYRHLRKQFSVGVDFPVSPEPLPIDPYILGLWLGDGTKNLRGFTISKPDPEIRESLSAFSVANGYRLSVSYPDLKCPQYSVRSNSPTGRGGFGLLDTMRELMGEAPHVPHAYRVASREHRLELLAGLMDTDGHLGGGGFEFCQRSREIFDGCVFVARSLGLKVTPGTRLISGVVYRRAFIFGDIDMIPTRIPRKKAAPRKQAKDPLRTGFSVEAIGDDDYFGFTLDGDGRFLLGDFTVTHNTFTFSRIAQCWPYEFDASPNVLVLAHREELVRQAAKSLSIATGEPVGIEKADERSSPKHRIVVGSVQSMNKARLDRLGVNRFGLVIFDECFPAGTLVDGRPIETIRTGELVLSLDHATGELARRKVVRVFKKPCPETVKVISCGATTLTATFNHPVFIHGKGYSSAEDIVPGDMLCMWTRVHGREGQLLEATEDVRREVQSAEVIGDYGAHEHCSRERSHDVPQPHAQKGSQGARFETSARDGSWAKGTGRQRPRPYPSSGATAGGSRGTLGSGAPDPYTSSSRFWIPDVLQGGPCSGGGEDRGRVGRPEPQLNGETAPGHEEGFVLAWSRVDSVEDQECPGDGFVYNLEVEGAHTYFANGILVHNCHHALAPSYRRAFEYFDAKLLGVTATPDRADEKALGQVFEDVAFTYDIENGIGDGFLVPLRGTSIQLDEIDISGVEESAGDLSAGQLDDAMFRAVNGIVSRSRELEPDRPALYFWPGVRCAEAAAARANALRPGSAAWVAGELRTNGTDCPVKDAIRRFASGELKELHNCQILTEGFDAPPTSLIVLGRPTKSRSLIVQKIGRGLRALPGVIDALPSRDDAPARRESIARSSKPDALVLDFVGNAGKHKLVGPVDALAGNYTEEEVEEAKKKLKKGDAADVRDALKEAREKLQRAARQANVKVKSRETKWNPFEVLDVDMDQSERYVRRFGFKPPSEKQVEALKKLGIPEEQLEGLSRHGASKLFEAMGKRREEGLATLKQLKTLRNWGITDDKLKFERASEAMTYLANNGWGRKGKIDPQKLLSIVYRNREPGDEG